MIKVKIIDSQLELEKAFEIRKKVFVEEQGVPLDIELDKYDKVATHFLALDKGKAVGTARIREYEESIKVERVATLKEYRGKGVGRILMLEIEKYTKANYKNRSLYLNSQDRAIEFYRELGYQEVGEEFIEAGILHQAMRKGV